HRKRHHVTGAARFADFRRADPLDFVDAHDGMHRYETAYHTLELRLELLFARIHHDGRTLAEDELFHLQETPQITLIDLLGIHLEYLSLVEENHLVDWSFAFGHKGRARVGDIKEGANYSMPAGQG